MYWFEGVRAGLQCATAQQQQLQASVPQARNSGVLFVRQADAKPQWDDARKMLQANGFDAVSFSGSGAPVCSLLSAPELAMLEGCYEETLAKGEPLVWFAD